MTIRPALYIALLSIAGCPESGTHTTPARNVETQNGFRSDDSPPDIEEQKATPTDKLPPYVEERIDSRTVDLTIDSPALGASAHARLLLPPDWVPKSERRWPVLYLLHGAGAPEGYRSWTQFTDVSALTARRNVLVVMPDAGVAGWYSDWWNDARGGPPKWETFHLVELGQILERRYQAGPARAIAGLSMGGMGAASYAARHPGMFRAVATYSGAVCTEKDPTLVQVSLSLSGFEPNAVWGDPVQQEKIWEAHDPCALAARLVAVPIFVSGGNGTPGPLDTPGTSDSQLERLLFEASQEFARRVEKLGGHVTTDFYGPGTHSWPYWEREFHRSFDLLMNTIGAERASGTGPPHEGGAIR